MTLNDLLERFDGVEIPDCLVRQIEDLTRYPIKDGSIYCVIASDGEIDNDIFNYESATDIGRYMNGNAFQTEEQAKAELEFRKIKRELRESGGAFGAIYENEAWYIALDLSNEIPELQILPVENHVSGALLTFKSEDSATRAVAKIGEKRLIQYWFGAII